jgi:hypothetical protein
MGRPAFRAALIGALAVAALAGLAWGTSHALTDSADLLRRAEEVALFLNRIDPYADPDLTYPPSAPPVFAALVAPFPPARLPVGWLALNGLALAALGWGLVHVWALGWSRADRLALLLAVAASKPVRAGLALGQFHLIPTALAVWAIPALRAGRPILAGLMLGVALIKPTMVLPLLGLWLVRGRGRAVASALGVQAALGLSASAWVGVGSWALLREWLANARTQEAAGTLDLPTLLAWALPGVAVPGSLLSLALLAACVGLLASCRRADEPTAGALALGLGAVFAYHRHYDLVLLLPALAWLAGRARRGGSPLASLALGLLALAWIVPTKPVPLAGFEAAHAALAVLAAYLALGVLAAGAAWPAGAAFLDDPGGGGYDEPRPPTWRDRGPRAVPCAGRATGGGPRRRVGSARGAAAGADGTATDGSI